MPTFRAEDDPSRLEDHPILVEARLLDWSPLGRSVGLELSPRCTVLVGKNATGKSLLLEGLALASGASGGWVRDDTVPRRAQFTFQSPTGGQFHFEYNLGAPSQDSDRSSQSAEVPPTARWGERCWREGESEDLWQVSHGFLRLRGLERPLVKAGMRLIMEMDGQTLRSDVELPPEMTWLETLQRVKLVKAGIPRSGPPYSRSDRGPLVLTRPAAKMGKLRESWQGAGSPRLIDLASTLLRWYQRNHDRFDELCELMRQVGVVQTAHVVDIQTDAYGGEVAQIFLDGLNLGLLSDGTLRALEILTALAGTAMLVLIEEPETGIYPGLLDRLLAVIESYSSDQQVVLSTHSPQVVSWGRPADLRLVERTEAQTQEEEFIRLSRGPNQKSRYQTNKNPELARDLDLGLCAQRCRAFRELRDFVSAL